VIVGTGEADLAQVTVTIAGKNYRMACADGEESHLESLGAIYDAKISEMRDAFGEIGDMRLHVMAALMIADELAEAKGAVARRDAELAELRGVVDTSDERFSAKEEQFAKAILTAAERVERAARSLNAPNAGAGEREQ
jgi:cell division protein ZapA